LQQNSYFGPVVQLKTFLDQTRNFR